MKMTEDLFVRINNGEIIEQKWWQGLPYRQIHLDFHTSPYIDGVGDRFDRAEFIKILKKAHVSSVNLFAKCHHGMYYKMLSEKAASALCQCG